MNEILKLNKVCFGYDRQHPILRNISAAILPGQTVTLLGPNGVGKSTLLNCVTGILEPQSGTITLSGRPISGLPRKTIAQTVAYVPQKPQVAFDYPLIDFVVMGRTAYMKLLSVPDKADYEAARSALRRLGIEELSERPVNELSGGEQQKACIARALVQEPELIVLDEPTSSLDYGNQITVLGLIRQLSADGFSVLMTTHDPDHALLLNSDVWLMNRAGELRCGSSGSLLTEENLSELYQARVRLLESEELSRRVCVIESI